MKKICILFGSPREKGNTSQLVQCFLKEAEQLGCPCEQYRLYEAILRCDLILLATPIYSWYCTPPMKAVLDRMVYGMNKYYGEKKGPAIWAGKEIAILTTCGYRPERGADLWEEGIRRYCRHSQLSYRGMLAERHMGYGTQFMDEAKKRNVSEFLAKLLD